MRIHTQRIHKYRKYLGKIIVPKNALAIIVTPADNTNNGSLKFALEQYIKGQLKRYKDRPFGTSWLKAQNNLNTRSRPK